MDEILEKVKKHVEAHPNQLIRVGTGEQSDSLALDLILGIIPHLAKRIFMLFLLPGNNLLFTLGMP